MNKFIYTLSLISVIFTQSAVAMQEEKQSHTALIKRNKTVKKKMDQHVPIPALQTIIIQFTGDFFKKVDIKRHFSPGTLGWDPICSSLTVGLVKDILEIDDVEGDLLPLNSNESTCTLTASFFCGGREFTVTACLPQPFISKQNYKDDEWVHDLNVCPIPQTDSRGKRYRSLYIPNRDIFLRPKDRYKSWVGCPGAGFDSHGGEPLDPNKYYWDSSIGTASGAVVVSET